MKPPVKKTETKVDIQEIIQQEIRVRILGTSPMIQHRYPLKAWREMLLPARKRNRAELDQTLKHQPYDEFREAAYVNRDKKAAAMFHIPNAMFHGALAAAALDIPGVQRTQIERLTKVVDLNIELYGVPQIFCAMVRNSGMNRAPDVRTRPVFPRWACEITVRYVSSIVTAKAVMNLLGAAGVIIGVGDWRCQKGGPFGAFRLVNDRDPDWLMLVKTEGRGAQEAAFAAPEYFDEDTADILSWWNEEILAREAEDLPVRGGNGRSAPPKTKRGVIVVDSTGGEEQIVGTE